MLERGKGTKLCAGAGLDSKRAEGAFLAESGRFLNCTKRCKSLTSNLIVVPFSSKLQRNRLLRTAANVDQLAPGAFWVTQDRAEVFALNQQGLDCTVETLEAESSLLWRTFSFFRHGQTVQRPYKSFTNKHFIQESRSANNERRPFPADLPTFPLYSRRGCLGARLAHRLKHRLPAIGVVSPVLRLDDQRPIGSERDQGAVDQVMNLATEAAALVQFAHKLSGTGAVFGVLCETKIAWNSPGETKSSPAQGSKLSPLQAQECSVAGTCGNGVPAPFSRFPLKIVGRCFKMATFWMRSHTFFCQHYIPVQATFIAVC